jgi:hypothetical protein
MGSVTMRRFDTGVLVRSALAAAAVLLAVGIAIAFAGENGKESVEPAPLVNPLAEQDLAKFAVIDMADAIGRVAGASRSDSGK